MPAVHAADLLKDPPAAAGVPAVAVLHGPQRALASRCVAAICDAVLGDGEEPSRVSGETADLASVLDELRTVSMFSSARVVVVDDADAFVSDHRAGLERYAAAPAAGGVLVLRVLKWPKSTRLAKAVAKSGLAVECSELSGPKAVSHLVAAAKREFRTTLEKDAARLLLTFAGPDLGLLEQELAKLCAYAADREGRTVTAEDVAELVQDQSVKNVFAMLADVRAGNLDGALRELDRLLAAGEAPLRLLGGIRFTVGKLAAATDLAAAGGLSGALRAAGVFPKERGESEAYLRRLGRPRAEGLRGLLLEADADLRGGSALTDRAVLERLLVRLAP